MSWAGRCPAVVAVARLPACVPAALQGRLPCGTAASASQGRPAQAAAEVTTNYITCVHGSVVPPSLCCTTEQAAHVAATAVQQRPTASVFLCLPAFRMSATDQAWWVVVPELLYRHTPKPPLHGLV